MTTPQPKDKRRCVRVVLTIEEAEITEAALDMFKDRATIIRTTPAYDAYDRINAARIRAAKRGG